MFAIKWSAFVKDRNTQFFQRFSDYLATWNHAFQLSVLRFQHIAFQRNQATIETYFRERWNCYPCNCVLPVLIHQNILQR